MKAMIFSPPVALFSSLLFATGAACGGDGQNNSTPDAEQPQIDAPPVQACSAPAPLVAGTAPTDAVANAPARCGAAPYQWKRDAALGTIKSSKNEASYTSSQLAALAQAAGLQLPRTPMFDTASARATYVTQDRGQLVDATAMVAWPTNATASSSVLMILHGTSGMRRACGPTSDSSSVLLASALASTGWVVVMPDYIGLESDGADYPLPHPYLVGEPTAIASLDGVRAAMNLSGQRGVCTKNSVAIIGGSQGGHAALWVDRLAPYYARELVIAGVASTVPPADLTAESVRAIKAAVPATSNVIATITTNAPWYGATSLSPWLQAPYSETIAATLESACDPSVEEPTNTALVFTQPLKAAAQAGTLNDVAGFGCWTKENSLTTTSIPRLPPAGGNAASYGVLYVLGELDQLVTTSLQRTAYDQLCAAGMPLQYLECAGAGHTQTTKWSLKELLMFSEDRVAAKPFAPGCTRQAQPTRCSGTE
jgi:dienelactone hydrolase